MNLDGFFQISERGSTARREVIAGLTTFLAMAYILFVNPSILTGGFELALSNALHVPLGQLESSPTYGPLIESVRLGFTIATRLRRASRLWSWLSTRVCPSPWLPVWAKTPS